MERAINRLASRQLGVITRQQLLELGINRDTITRLIAKGRLLKVHRGVYRVGGLPVSFEQLLMAALLAGGRDAVISHLAAAHILGLEGVVSTQPELSVPPNRSITLGSVTVHRTTVSRRDSCRRGPLRLTTPARTLVDLAGVLSPQALEDALDDALRRKLTSLSTVRSTIERRGRRGVRGIATLQALIDARTPGRTPGSAKENDLRRLLVSAGLPAPVTQYEICDQRGRFVARPDLAYPQACLAIEYDGEGHAYPRQRQSDLRRQNRLINAGWLVLRYCHLDLIERPAEVVDEVRRALAFRTRLRRRARRPGGAAAGTDEGRAGSPR